MLGIGSLLIGSLLGYQAPACNEDTECATGQLCVLNECRDEKPASKCSVDTDCQREEVCTNGACTAPAPAPAPALVPAPAVGCTRDDQCKGDRLCAEGRCAAPEFAPAPAPAPAPVFVPPAGVAADGQPPRDGWALAGGITTLSMMLPVLGLGIASELTREDQIPAIPLGASATVLIAAAIPIGASAGASARRGAHVRGSLGLRITSWVAYGVSLSNALALIGLGIAEIEPWPGAITTTTVLGVAAGAMMGADALASHKQAREKIRTYQGQTASFGFGVAPLPTSIDGRGATFGAAGRF